ncbi:molybdopterin-dependent oxidoreductase [Pengzhenrongella frigida]|uniref:Oxidoreductase n=1 Tax=Pengzhenrongella frigida TaxID=1259133 RepID=A0A4Q5N758_9MICO|nr:molybdopterin-dependent oxidoreductase [Cellulomonas sp. HLT2-17]RYV52917.1 oxidoreductase [Cellulomonas sp. HLT2-17]
MSAPLPREPSATPGADDPRPPALSPEVSATPTVLAAVAGILAAATTLGVAQLMSALVSPDASPLVAVGGAFIDATPPWLKDFAVATFGTADKLVLLIGMGLVITALAALAGVLGRRRWWLGAALVVLLAGVGAAAAALRPGAGTLAPLPSIAGAAAGLYALRALLARIPEPAPSSRSTAASDSSAASDTSAASTTTPGGFDRRSFLTAAVVTTAIAALAAVGGQLLSQATRTVQAARAAIRLPGAARPAAALAPGVEVDVVGVTSFVTPNDDFYRIDTALLVPQVDVESWSLRVHGLVEEEVVLSFQDLLDAELVESWVTLTCVSNEVGGTLAGNAKWLGLPVREVLARARPTADADMVLSTSSDGFTASTPLGALTDDRDSLLAIGMNGEPLPIEHGFPVRMMVPGLYGYVSATKWVVDLEVTRFADRRAYWTDRGWSAEGPIKTASRIEVPRPGASVSAGRVAVGGTAWAQHRGITRVEVRVDDGDWAPATLATEASVDTWRQWSYAWDATAGDHTLTVRATDGTDEVQTSQTAAPAPDGASGWHSVDVSVS